MIYSRKLLVFSYLYLRLSDKKINIPATENSLG